VLTTHDHHDEILASIIELKLLLVDSNEIEITKHSLTKKGRLVTHIHSVCQWHSCVTVVSHQATTAARRAWGQSPDCLE